MVINRRFLKIFIPLLTLFLTVTVVLWTLTPRAERVTVRYAVLFTVENELVSAFAVGDRLTDGVGKGALGTVTAVEVSPAMEENESGAFPLPHKSRMVLTVESEGERKGDVLTVGGIPLLVGNRLSLHGKGTAYALCLWAEEAKA